METRIVPPNSPLFPEFKWNTAHPLKTLKYFFIYFRPDKLQSGGDSTSFNDEIRNASQVDSSLVKISTESGVFFYRERRRW